MDKLEVHMTKETVDTINKKLSDQHDQIDRLQRACIFAYHELEFGGDWYVAKRKIIEALQFAGASLSPLGIDQEAP